MYKVSGDLLERIYDGLVSNEKFLSEKAVVANTPKNKKNLVEATKLKAEVQAYLPQFNQL